jgi:hypothetical protein
VELLLNVTWTSREALDFHCDLQNFMIRNLEVWCIIIGTCKMGRGTQNERIRSSTWFGYYIVM